MYITASEAGLIGYKWACKFLARSAGAAGNQEANVTWQPSSGAAGFIEALLATGVGGRLKLYRG